MKPTRSRCTTRARLQACLLAGLASWLCLPALAASPAELLQGYSDQAAAPPQAARGQAFDSGPGLAEADRARLGERFFRVLGSSASGSGLGWSIVRRIADTQGAAVQVGRSATLGGLGVTVQWPAAPDPAPGAQ